MLVCLVASWNSSFLRQHKPQVVLTWTPAISWHPTLWWAEYIVPFACWEHFHQTYWFQFKQAVSIITTDGVTLMSSGPWSTLCFRGISLRKTRLASSICSTSVCLWYKKAGWGKSLDKSHLIPSTSLLHNVCPIVQDVHAEFLVTEERVEGWEANK